MLELLYTTNIEDWYQSVFDLDEDLEIFLGLNHVQEAIGHIRSHIALRFQTPTNLTYLDMLIEWVTTEQDRVYSCITVKPHDDAG